MSILVNSLLRRPELRKVYSLLLRGREYFASSPEPSNPRPPPTRARAGIKEVHYLPFNPVDKRTALTYIESDANWHRVSKGAPDLANARPALRQKVLARSLSRTTFGTRGFSSEIEMPSQQTPMSFADIAERVVPAVVEIFTEPSLAEMYAGPISSNGSGFFINPSTVLTCASVVVGKRTSVGTRVYIILNNGASLTGSVESVNVEIDLATVKIDKWYIGKFHYSCASFCTHNRLRQGDPVLAIGSSAGFRNSVSAGVISHMYRNDVEIEMPAMKRIFIQTDCAVNQALDLSRMPD